MGHIDQLKIFASAICASETPLRDFFCSEVKYFRQNVTHFSCQSLETN